MAKREITLDRRRFVRWLEKYWPDNKDLLIASVARIAMMLEELNFQWIEKDREGYRPQIHAVEFDRRVDRINYDMIYVKFNKGGHLQFDVSFGRLHFENKYEFRNAADFVKHQSDSYYSAKLWGARWYHLNKRKAFEEAWNKFEETIPDIVKYLDNGTPHPNIRAPMPRIDPELLAYKP